MRRFIRACRREKTDRVPVSLMRQAGRYMAVYRDLKNRVCGFGELCTRPDAIAQATLDAQRLLGTDADMIFSDTLLPAWAMGLELVFDPGPKFTPSVRSLAQVRAR